jgi:uncharacterized protein YbjT (DUF2867 family)
MNKILITGATGNIGTSLVDYLIQKCKQPESIIAGVRSIEKARKSFVQSPLLTYRTFDFENSNTFKKAFEHIDILFLLRPPHLSDVKAVFKPLLMAAKRSGIKKIVFLSVQGVERSSIIPHHKIEALIKKFNFEYIFVRPAYFMQNLTTSLLPGILTKNEIALPSKQAKFNWVDVHNIGEATAALILQFEDYKNQAFDITGLENMSFAKVAQLISAETSCSVYFKNIDPIRFYFHKRREGVESGFALVMTILHFLPRFQDEPIISNNYTLLTGKKPTTLVEFIKREKVAFEG